MYSGIPFRTTCNLLYVFNLFCWHFVYIVVLIWVSLLKPSGNSNGFRLATILLVAGVYHFLHLTTHQDEMTWHHVSSAFARYFIAFPGGVLAAYGLREHAKLRILPLGVPSIYNALRISGVALAMYAVLGGLVPASISFWPGNVVNTETFEMWIGVPPLAFRTLIGLILAISTIRALEVFNLETGDVSKVWNTFHLSMRNANVSHDPYDGAIQRYIMRIAGPIYLQISGTSERNLTTD
jgi:hypothetical protein